MVMIILTFRLELLLIYIVLLARFLSFGAFGLFVDFHDFWGLIGGVRSDGQQRPLRCFVSFDRGSVRPSLICLAISAHSDVSVS